ncbi:hypothetical protein M2351_005101 [Azospirillum canadense]|nr:hypothetical protein [Azospirillum canadense]
MSKPLTFMSWIKDTMKWLFLDFPNQLDDEARAQQQVNNARLRSCNIYPEMPFM